MVTVESWTVQRSLNASSFHIFTPCILFACLNTVPIRKSVMNPLSIPTHRTHFNASQRDLVAKGLFWLWALLDTSFGWIISKLEGSIAKGRTYWNANAVIAFGNDVAVVPGWTFKDALLTDFVCKHEIKSAVDPGVWTVWNADSFVVEIFSILVRRAESGLDTGPSAVLPVGWNGGGWTDFNTNS